MKIGGFKPGKYSLQIDLKPPAKTGPAKIGINGKHQELVHGKENSSIQQQAVFATEGIEIGTDGLLRIEFLPEETTFDLSGIEIVRTGD